MMRKVILILTVISALFASAVEIPKASAKALGRSTGKPCSSGLVFINGKYIEPPYVVERWGNGIRINNEPVIAQVVDWTEFIKTQPGAKMTKTEAPVETEEEAEAEDEDDDLDDMYDDDEDSSLDDLFDDDPKPAKKASKKPAKKAKVKKATRKPKATVSYTLDGEFVANEASKKLVARINKLRTDINTSLVNGGVQMFGDKYARVSADSHAAEMILTNLPEIEKRCKSASDLLAQSRSVGIVFMSAPIAADLYRNKVDYIRLQQRREKWKKDREFKKMLNGSGRNSLY